MAACEKRETKEKKRVADDCTDESYSGEPEARFRKVKKILDG